MIFVTIGSAVKGIEFTRLIKQMDEVARNIRQEVIMQIGTVPYEPQHTAFFRYCSYQDMLEYFRKASLVVGHCGTGTILNALAFQKPIVVVPRRIMYGELNRDDHQMEIAQRLVGNRLIKVVYDVEDIEPALEEMMIMAKQIDIQSTPFERDALIKKIKDFVDCCA